MSQRAPCKAVCGMRPGNCLSRAVVGGDDQDILAAGKSICRNDCISAWNDNLSERRTAFKSDVGDFGDAVREGQFSQHGAVEEGIAVNSGDTAGKENGDGRFVAVGDGECPHAGIVFKRFKGKKRIIRTGEGISVVGQRACSLTAEAAESDGGASIESIGMQAFKTAGNCNLFKRRAAVKRMRAEQNEAVRE